MSVGCRSSTGINSAALCKPRLCCISTCTRGRHPAQQLRRRSSPPARGTVLTVVTAYNNWDSAMSEKPAAVVVGAGPGGALAALALAQQGWDVNVFEARPQPDPEAQEGHRSYAMVILVF